jgi:hypothetical protein
MRNNLDKTLDDVDIPRDENWEFEYETATQSHWYRKNVSAEEAAEDTDAYSPQDYREKISDEYMAFSVTIRYDDSGWTVSFVAPSIRKGMGDVDSRYSMKAGTLEEAITHVERVLERKGPDS